MKTVVRHATLEDARELALVLRPPDEAECLASGYASAEAALEAGVRESTEAWAITFDGELGVVLGVERQPGGTYIWCLTGKVVDRAKLSFWRISKAIVEQARITFGDLVCLSDDRYHRAHAWLNRLGFEYERSVNNEKTGQAFVVMSIGRL